MERFTRLYLALDQSTRTSEKVEALKHYFQTAPPEDSIWALYLFTGRKIGRTIAFPQLRALAVETTGYPAWLVQECNLVAGDFSETLSLLLPPPDQAALPEALHTVIEHLQSLGHLPPVKQSQTLRELWSRLDTDARFVLHKLISGNFRVGVSEQLVVRTLAEAAGVDPAIMAHRVAGKWQPSAALMEKFLAPPADSDAPAHDPSLPYPFMLAHALADPPESLGNMEDWLFECKWDGIRAQLIRRANKTFLWSRGDQTVASAFPDLLRAAAELPEGTVLDGEIVAWNPATATPLPFNQLQPRINRKHVELSFWPDVPIMYFAFDLLEFMGEDFRRQPLAHRRERLAQIVGVPENSRQAASSQDNGPGGQDAAQALIRLSTALRFNAWTDVPEWLARARDAGIEGLMLKQKSSPYLPGRPTGLWWKLKVQPFSVDAVLIAAQPGHGRRAGLLTDYTFAVWDKGELVTIAKAYSGLSDEELVELDRFIRQNSTERYGPVYSVPPTRVFEIAFEAIQKSDRHKSGVAVRFPRIVRERPDKSAQDADTLGTLQELLHSRQKLSQ